ncbi:class I SAM-dependent methyltransferase [Glycomyces buryatensis]|uniref:Methyltransferase domain-containing protein n=1 Tax=Glycomyces buryatensis TaxID=2570927 RepID=A0A4S8Q398_9ACTN|nr:methyltransferase domain-containing protein [Glycomyces buryatensis]THV34644.1 methyltransferase domain-containing protein [Glycomyces buryatensis]
MVDIPKEAAETAHHPRDAVVWSVLSAEIERYAAGTGATMRILDVGGGSGGFAVPLAELGHDVTVVEPSANALASLRQRAADAGVTDRVTAVQADADELPDVVEAGSHELVLCHSVLEMVEYPDVALDELSRVCAPGGAVSLLVSNRIAAVLGKALAGQFATALDLLVDVDGVIDGKDTIKHRFETATLTALVASSGLVTEQVHGVGVVGDLLGTTAAAGGETGSGEALREFELATAARVPFRDMATHLHLLGRRPVR